jgi:hypothetical protein
MHAGEPGVSTKAVARHVMAADETLGRITRARTDADTANDEAAEQAWRRIATLASRLHREAGAVVAARRSHATRNATSSPTRCCAAPTATSASAAGLTDDALCTTPSQGASARGQTR